MEWVVFSLGALCVFLWFISGMFRDRRSEIERELQREQERRDAYREARDEYRANPTFRQRVHDFFNR